jgi:hypothetical protein
MILVRLSELQTGQLIVVVSRDYDALRSETTTVLHIFSCFYIV